MLNKDITRCSNKNALKSQKLVILSLTKRCNLHCVYCRTNAHDWYDKLSGGSYIVDFDKKLWEDFAIFCQNNNIAEVLLSGGEPVEYPYFKEFCLFLKSKNIKFSIHTNGVSLKWDEILDFFNIHNMKPDIYISLELFDDLQESLRGAKIPYAFLDRIIDSGFWVELKITLTGLLLDKHNLLREKLEEWADRGISSIRFQPVVPVGRDTPKDVLLDETFIPILNLLQDCQMNNKKVGPLFRHSPLSYLSIIEYLQGKCVTKRCADSCCAIDQIVFITTDYKFLNCKSLWEKDEAKPCTELFDLVCCGFLD